MKTSRTRVNQQHVEHAKRKMALWAPEEDASTFSYTGPPPQISKSGRLLAYTVAGQLVVRSTATRESVFVKRLPDTISRSVRAIAWDDNADSEEERLAVCGRAEVHTFALSADGVVESNIDTGRWEVEKVQWMSWIGGDGASVVRLCVFTELGMMATIWSADGAELELAYPKLAALVPRGRENTGRYSAICRQGGSAVLINVNIVSGQLSTAYSKHPGVYGVLVPPETGGEQSSGPSLDQGDMSEELILGSVVASQFAFDKMVDVRDVSWSPDGFWLAAIDAPGAGYKVGFWSATGRLMKMYTEENTLTVREPVSIAWTLDAGDHKPLLLVADTQEEVSVFDTLAFRPAVRLRHGTVLDDICVWEASGEFDDTVSAYRLLKRPWKPQRGPKTGIDMAVSGDDAFLAVQLGSLTSVVWIWSLDEMQLVAVLMHDRPVRSMQWSHGLSRLLIALEGSDILGVWDSQVGAPLQIRSSTIRATGGSWVSDNTLLLWDRSQVSFISLEEVFPTEPLDQEEGTLGDPRGYTDSFDADDTFAARRAPSGVY